MVLCSVCKKDFETCFACSACSIFNQVKPYRLCSKACQKRNWKRHKNSDECVPAFFMTKMKSDFEWHMEAQGDRALTWEEYANHYFSVSSNFDKKILVTHGFKHWITGDRTQNGMFCVQYFHVCDVLTVLPNSPAEPHMMVTNIFDGLTEDEISFVYDNREILWVGYHDIGSNLLIKMDYPPGSERCMEIFYSEKFKQQEQAKAAKQSQSNPMDNFLAGMMDDHGLLRAKKR